MQRRMRSTVNSMSRSVMMLEPGDMDKVIVRYENNGSWWEGVPGVHFKAMQGDEHDREHTDRQVGYD